MAEVDLNRHAVVIKDLKPAAARADWTTGNLKEMGSRRSVVSGEEPGETHVTVLPDRSTSDCPTTVSQWRSNTGRRDIRHHGNREIPVSCDPPVESVLRVVGISDVDTFNKICVTPRLTFDPHCPPGR